MHIGKAKLSMRVLGLTMGSIAAIHILILGGFGMAGIGVELIQVIASLLVGFEPSIAGIVIGTAWAFMCGGVTGIVFAWLYNKML